MHACMHVCPRERESIYVCTSEREREGERERVCQYVCTSEREREKKKKKKRERVCVYAGASTTTCPNGKPLGYTLKPFRFRVQGIGFRI